MSKRVYRTHPPEDDRQFVVIWEYDGKLWSQEYRKQGKESYGENWDEWGLCGWMPKPSEFITNITYIWLEN